MSPEADVQVREREGTERERPCLNAGGHARFRARQPVPGHRQAIAADGRDWLARDGRVGGWGGGVWRPGRGGKKRLARSTFPLRPPQNAPASLPPAPRSIDVVFSTLTHTHTLTQATTEEVAQLAALYDEANIQVEAALSEASVSAPTAARAAASPAVAKANVRRSKAAASPAAAKPSVSKSVAELEAGIDENVFELQMLAEEVGV